MKKSFLLALLVGGLVFSAQGRPYFSSRIVEGEAAASLFIGAMIGENLFIQNELANSRDFGVASTIKGVFNFNR